jgi:hypothetical protein
MESDNAPLVFATAGHISFNIQMTYLSHLNIEECIKTPGWIFPMVTLFIYLFIYLLAVLEFEFGPQGY